MYFYKGTIKKPEEDTTFFDGIMQGLLEALAYERGEIELKTTIRSTDELEGENQ